MKNRRLIRFCLLLLCGILLFGAAACGKEQKNEPDPTPVETSAPVEGDNLPERNMEKFELVFLNYTDAAHGYSLKTLCTDDVSQPINESIFYRNLEIEDRFNAVISEQQTATMIDTLTKAVMADSGEKFQIAMITDEKVNVAYVAGLLSTWESMTYCDFSREWWNEDAGNCFSLNGVQYGAVGDFSLSMHSKNYCYFFNRKIYSSIEGTDDLYSLVRNKEWTVERMIEIGEQYTMDLDGDGLWYDGTDQYGIAGTTKVNYQLLLSGAGIKYVDLDANGLPYFTLGDARYITMLSDLIDLFSDTNCYYNNNPSSPNGGIVSNTFLDGHVLFFASTVWNMKDYNNYDIDFGVLPAPLYQEGQSRYYSVAVGGEVACVSRSMKAEDAENVSILLEALSCYSHQKNVPVYKENTLKSRYSKAPEDAEMLQLIFDSTIFDLGTSVWNIDIRRPIMENLFNELNSGVASYIKTLEPLAKGAIEKSMNVTG